jgi:hypothetical protein
VQSHPEHQQHHADLGELPREREVGHEAGGGRTDQHARDEVADQRRQAQPHRDEAEQQRDAEGGRQRGDQRDVVAHDEPCTAAPPARHSGASNPQAFTS